jgi:iron complex outermembrane receptor protein
MRNKAWLLAGVAISLMSLATGGQASAQASQGPVKVNSADAQPAGGSGAPDALPEVVVTAQRRSENLQKVPISVTSFSASDLAAGQITSSLDLGREVPNMFASNNVGQGSANVFFIRGLGQTQSFPTFQPQVGAYIDDIYLSRVNANNFALFGVQQVQVLNGPQGTLFGSNSTGGAIVVTLDKPGKTFGGDVSGTYGSFNGFTGRASVSMPLSDQVLTLTSLYGITNEGYVEDLTTHQKLNATNNYGVREAVTLLPKNLSNVEWNLSVDFEHNDSANLLNQPSNLGGVDGSGRISYTGFTTQGGALANLVLGKLTGDKAHFGQGAVVESYGAASNIKVSLDAGVLNFITGFRGINQALGADFPSGGLGPLSSADAISTGEITLAQALRNWQLSQEIKWTATLNDKFNYTAGAFYLYESNRTNYGQVLGLASLDFTEALNDQFFKNDRLSEAVYAQGDYKFWPNWTLTVGGRFTHEMDTVTALPNSPGLGYTTAQILAAGYQTHLDANEFTPHVNLSYQIDPNLMVFASATRGFQGGGWNGLTGSSASDFNSFKPETIWSYETGFRSETPDHKLRLNVNLFYENVHDDQVLYDNPHTNSFDTSNAADFAAYGLEANIKWRPIQHLTLTSNIGMIDGIYFDQSSIIKAQQASCVAGNAGSCQSGIVTATGALAKPDYLPPFSITQSASYVIDFDRFTLTPNVSIQYVAREWFDTANTPGAASSSPSPVGGLDKPRTLIDIGVTYASKNLPLTFTAECKNCTMVNYGTADLLGLDYFNTPGTWDISVAYKF